MLTEEQNRRLTQVGAGTPMGELLRRYWMPIAAEDEFDRNPVKAVRLMGEDLVLYRDMAGTYGLVDRHCPHRRADLSYGFVEPCGIRCNYHGWHFDESGRCIEQPFEDVANPDAHFRDKVRIKAYPVETKGGLVWAYLGPQPLPLLPNFEPFTWQNGFVQIVFATIPCNWLQCQENSIDPVHFEWMHRNWTVRLNGTGEPYGKKHLRVAFDEFEYGFVYKRLMEGMDESHERWQTGRICLWPNGLGPLRHTEYRVPIDDENTLSVTWHFSRVPKEREPYVQTTIPSWEGPIRDPRTGRWISSHVMNQDFIAWVGQGTIADRTQEHLGSSDRGIIAMRRRFLEDMERIERGEDPKGIVRDPARNVCITLPIIERDLWIDGVTTAEMLGDASIDPRSGYNLQLGQPEAVRRAFLDAMGLDADGPADGGARFLSGTGARSSRRIWT
ncbi:MAG TPA: aromatic ring-hydroxylating dioxygenase subunit alpha [Candidatus Lustribacter sp.]|nr:aromatic ring-hydroxylating dioxygenase subunit alpha [Candidatus Lustribacter sp.]